MAKSKRELIFKTLENPDDPMRRAPGKVVLRMECPADVGDDEVVKAAKKLTQLAQQGRLLVHETVSPAREEARLEELKTEREEAQKPADADKGKGKGGKGSKGGSKPQDAQGGDAKGTEDGNAKGGEG